MDEGRFRKLTADEKDLVLRELRRSFEYDAKPLLVDNGLAACVRFSSDADEEFRRVYVLYLDAFAISVLGYPEFLSTNMPIELRACIEQDEPPLVPPPFFDDKPPADASAAETSTTGELRFCWVLTAWSAPLGNTPRAINPGGEAFAAWSAMFRGCMASHHLGIGGILWRKGHQVELVFTAHDPLASLAAISPAFRPWAILPLGVPSHELLSRAAAFVSYHYADGRGDAAQ